MLFSICISFLSVHDYVGILLVSLCKTTVCTYLLALGLPFCIIVSVTAYKLLLQSVKYTLMAAYGVHLCCTYRIILHDFLLEETHKFLR